jgi:phospholipid/cholesterol/gamma-HCH transport system substrate-binding protein
MITGTDSRFRNLERKVGLFVLCALIGILGVILFIVMENDLFKATYNVVLTSPKGTGFSPGMPIKLSGFRIGRVKSITLNDSAAVDVVLQIDKKYRKWLRKDSIARLIKEGMIGDYIIEISSGTSSELIPDNGTIALGKTKALDELAEEIADKVKPVLMDIRDIIAYINGQDGDLKQSLHKLNTFAGNLEKSRQNADQLMNETRKTIDNTSRKFDILLTKSGNRLDQAGPVLQKIDSSLERIDGELPSLLTKLDKSLTNLESLSGQLRSTSSETLPRVPQLLDKTEGVIDQGEFVLEGVKWIWPFSNLLPQESGTLLRGSGRD